MFNYHEKKVWKREIHGHIDISKDLIKQIQTMQSILVDKCYYNKFYELPFFLNYMYQILFMLRMHCICYGIYNFTLFNSFKTKFLIYLFPYSC
jgi:hypothetical protein